VFAVAYSPDGKVLVTAEPHGIATLWEVSSARKLGIVRAAGKAFYSLAFSDDGKTFATGGADGIVRLWDVAQALGPSNRTSPEEVPGRGRLRPSLRSGLGRSLAPENQGKPRKVRRSKEGLDVIQ
jgi:WD40 repeat protein